MNVVSDYDCYVGSSVDDLAITVLSEQTWQPLLTAGYFFTFSLEISKLVAGRT